MILARQECQLLDAQGGPRAESVEQQSMTAVCADSTVSKLCTTMYTRLAHPRSLTQAVRVGPTGAYFVHRQHTLPMNICTALASSELGS